MVILTCSFLSPSQRRERNGKEPETPKPATYEAPTIAAYNAPARVDVADGWDFFVTGDFIYWQTVEDGLAYAASTERTPSAAALTEPPLNGKILNVDFDWHPGVKLGFGGNTERDDWDVYLQWTHLVSHNNTSSGTPEGGFLIPGTAYPNIPLGCVGQAFSSWRCIYNTIDLEVGRLYYMGKYWTVRTHGGLRGSWIRQSHNTEFTNLFINVNDQAVSVGDLHNNKEFNTWGLGPRIGLDFNWRLGWGWKFFEKNALCVQYTKPSAKLKELLPVVTTRPEVKLRNTKGTGTLRPNFDIEAGFGWGTYFDNYHWHVDLALSYEFHYWWDQNFDVYPIDDFNFATLDATRGNLGLHGGTFRVRFDF